MTDLAQIKDSIYFKSLTEAEQKTLFDSFGQWPAKQQEEFVTKILKMTEQREAIDLANQLEGAMKDLSVSAKVAMKEEEHSQKSEDSDEAEAMLTQAI